MFRRVFGFLFRLAVTTVLVYRFLYRPWRRRWQASEVESARLLPGDDLVPQPQFVQTMALTIDAPPAAVWPWLVQMGYRRAGWYSYDAIDMLGDSARTIRPDLQDVREGQVIPLAPNMGFEVKLLEPERAIVLYGDSELIAQQQRAAPSDGEREETPGLKAVGLLADANMRSFAVSWAFVLDPLTGDRTRLLERFRTTTTPGPASAIVTPIIDVGHFLMTRKHMLGVRERAERGTDQADRPRRTARPDAAKRPGRRTVVARTPSDVDVSADFVREAGGVSARV